MRCSAPLPARGLALLPALAVLLLLPSPPEAAAQEDPEEPIEERIEESQERLERIRKERARLRREMQKLTSRVHAVAEEIENLEQRIGRSTSVVAEIRIQINALEKRISQTTRELLRTRDRLTAAKVVLRQRLEEIYKRGPLSPLKVLLTSSSFSDLIHRYKYLHLVTLHDRILVNQVQELEARLQEHRNQLARQLARLQGLRQQRVGELAELEELERQRRRRLENYRARRSRAENRMAQLAQEEEKLRSLLEKLERARREEERRAGRASESSLTAEDLGQLGWPVEGEVLYRFGPHRSGNSTVMREGVGIEAEAGTPVRAVEAGEVVFADRHGLYGPSVILSHGGGYYSLYLYLRNLAVRSGDRVRRGGLLGQVGGEQSPEGPHLEFQIRKPNPSGQPQPVDPLEWLREQR